LQLISIDIYDLIDFIANKCIIKVVDLIILYQAQYSK